MATLQLKNINKIYDNNVQAVFDFNLEIKDKEFIVFVGPSGCGKSTTLRMIAGLEDITSGELFINEAKMNDVLPKDRDIAMVFQSYALYPHLSVYDNMAFGLQIRKVPKAEIDARVRDAAKILEITDYLDRKPKALSGGQRQRVALGRAIVRNAEVFLMDEPLSNLDAKLRVAMRSEIIKLHERVGATTIYVTHDQTEAMTMATRIVVMKDGYIQQIGTPKEIYNNPANMFVAGFVGSPATNFLHGRIENNSFVIGDLHMELPEKFDSDIKDYEGKEVVMGIRPEDIYSEGIVEGTYPSASFTFQVDISELLGHESILHGTFYDQPLIAKVSTRLGIESHSQTKLTFDLGKVHFFDVDTTLRIDK
ncbi:multiple sugar transport system ATP-binding protein [Breznakia blatticola]|uniref:Multiple sugar transport system ATP-binding protein n=1 Tax=Breznakia blatticola TaxID=1754012 RepID=A0A4R7ZR10_9FIRM|nr:sn-glycerol-3-phosphate ABC transporter ATP-binding protein UgpC [Breznakia blatticola]TDW20045.1 multiple sugar transport system ATP-binding protein [Breznakia blatticola]